MSKSKIIAGIIFLIVYFVPFQMVFLTNEIYDSGKFIGLFMATILGYFLAFAIGTNKPFDKKRETIKDQFNERTEMKKAA